MEYPVGLMSKTTSLHVQHAFLYISLLSLHNYNVKWPQAAQAHYVWVRASEIIRSNLVGIY